MSALESENKEIKDFKVDMRTSLKVYKNTLNNIEIQFRRTRNKLTNQVDFFSEILRGFENKMNEIIRKQDSIEETFLILYSNIKHNQFLFSNYPDDWVDEFRLKKERETKDERTKKNITITEKAIDSIK